MHQWLALILVLAAVAGPWGCDSTDKNTSSEQEEPSIDDSAAPADSDDEDSADTADTGDVPARYAAFVAQLEEDLDASSASGVSAAILDTDGTVFWVARGSAHPEKDTAIWESTLFQMGSTTKMFTAVALLQDVENKRLSLDDSLASVYPDSDFAYDEDWNDQITMNHLLTHQGAFYDYFDWSRSEEDEDLAAFHQEIFFPYLWLMNDPGLFWNYANPNYMLSGLVSESVDPDGRMYPDLMVDNVFQPLGMDRTWMRKSEAEADGDYALGTGYIVSASGALSEGSVLMEDVPDLAHARPAGAGTWTTPTQMLEMARFLMDGDETLLADSLRQGMTENQVDLLSSLEGWGYGHGVMVGPGLHLGDDYQETEVWNHDGNTLSYSASLYILPEHRFAICILSSGYGTSFNASVATAIASLVDLGGAEEAPELPWDTDRLDDHVGTYEDIYNVGEIIIDRQGNSLSLQMPDLTALGFEVAKELYPVTDSIFYAQIDGEWYDLTFIGEAGSSTEYVRNRVFVGTRSGDSGTENDIAPQGPPRQMFESDLHKMRLSRVPLLSMPAPPE